MEKTTDEEKQVKKRSNHSRNHVSRCLALFGKTYKFFVGRPILPLNL